MSFFDDLFGSKPRAPKIKAKGREGSAGGNAGRAAAGDSVRRAQSQTVQLAKGLTKKEAYRAASKKAKGDFRGFSYDEKTGKAVMT